MQLTKSQQYLLKAKEHILDNLQKEDIEYILNNPTYRTMIIEELAERRAERLANDNY